MGKVSDDQSQSSSSKPRDFFQEDVLGSDLPHNSIEVIPDPALVLDALALAGRGPGLARDAHRDDLNEATPRSAVEGLDVIPDRERRKRAVLLTRDQCCRCKGFPLHSTNKPVGISEGQAESLLDPPDAGAEGEPVESGT
jgi:hypothetical protein